MSDTDSLQEQNQPSQIQVHKNKTKLLSILCLFIFINAIIILFPKQSQIPKTQQPQISLTSLSLIRANDSQNQPFQPKIQKPQPPPSRKQPKTPSSRFYKYALPQRTKLQQPQVIQTFLWLWSVTNTLQSQSQNNCIFINSANIVTKQTLVNVKKFLNNNQLKTVYILASFSSFQTIAEGLKDYKIGREDIQFNSSYSFLSSLEKCKTIAYTFSSFQFQNEMIDNIVTQVNALKNNSMVYSSTTIKNKNKQTLPSLNTTDLATIDRNDFYFYLYIFDSHLLNMVSPLSFSYYCKYTFEELLIIPLLALHQKKGTLIGSSLILHSFHISYIQSKQITLRQPTKTQRSVCFVSYPNDPEKVNATDAISYLGSVFNQQFQLSGNISVVLYLPYSFSDHFSDFQKIFNQIVVFREKVPQIPIKIRFVNEKALSSYAVYDSAYSYCPQNSVIVSSRHNVQFGTKFMQKLIDNISSKYHYYFVKYENQNGEITGFSSPPKDVSFGKVYDPFKKRTMPKKQQIRHSKHFQNQLRHIQIFKTDLMKMCTIWDLRIKQFEFYQTESAFITYMMELTRFKIGIIDEVLAKIKSRPIGDQEQSEIDSVKTYSEYSQIPSNQLVPYLYNSLENPALRRNAPFVNTPIIHQIWLGSSPINPIREKLRNSFIQVNKNFTVLLWRDQNITKQNTPMTYFCVHKVLEMNKQAQNSIFAMAADLLRYQLLFRYGGIYADFKFEGKKPMDAFLKYKLFFINLDLNHLRLGSPKVLGNGAMGASPNNYHLGYIIQQLINEGNLNEKQSIIKITGSEVLRKSLTNNEVFTQTWFGFQLLIPHPYDNLTNLCGGFDKTFTPDQEVFKVIPNRVQNFLNKNRGYKGKTAVKIGIPCYEYPYAYMINYSPLAGTWIVGKTAIN